VERECSSQRHLNLYGFWNETTFLTKSGDAGIVVSISGVDYESLDRSEQEYAVSSDVVRATSTGCSRIAAV
jgi:type IV secretory pathway VirB4 component